jgi:hypothetical protein
MNRITEISFDNCLQCPWLQEYDNYASHTFVCNLLNIETNEISDPESHEVATEQLEDWFENKCTLS